MGLYDDTFGAWFIGQQVAVFCFGASILQAWIFFKTAGQDAKALQALVAIVVSLGFVLVVLTAKGLYFFLVSSIGNLENLATIPSVLTAEPYVTSVTLSCVQFFYAFRLLRLYKSWSLFGCVATLSLLQLAMGSAAATIELSHRSGIVSASLTKTIACTALGADLACDTLILVAMLYFLQTHRTGVRSTEQLMNALVVYTLASGFLTFVGSALTLIMYLSSPQTQIYSAISFILPHLYINSLLAVLNARHALRQRSETAPSSLSGRPSAQVFTPNGGSSEAHEFKVRIARHMGSSDTTDVLDIRSPRDAKVRDDMEYGSTSLGTDSAFSP